MTNAVRRKISSPLRRAVDAVRRFRLRYRVGSLPILIYALPKTASTSIHMSLNAVNIPSLHVHVLSPANITRIAAERRANGLPVRDERLSLAVHARLQRTSEKVRIITSVREPISRNISAFFQRLSDFYGDRPPATIPANEATERFLTEYSHDVPLEWFDVEFGKVTDVSIYDYPFPYEQGWSIVRSGRFEILILRVESSDAAKKEALSRFLGRPDIELVRSNTAEDKDYAVLYKEFRKQIRVPESYVDRMLNSRYARHFYSNAELEKFREYWLAPKQN